MEVDKRNDKQAVILQNLLLWKASYTTVPKDKRRLPCGFQHDTGIDRQISALSDIHTVTTSRQHKDI